MAYSHECPICGANLDPSEKCECKADKVLPHSDGDSPEVKEAVEASKRSKSTILRTLRISRNIPAKDMVLTVQQLYPKYDKMLQSKCENDDKYGIEIKSDALALLIDKYSSPEANISRNRDGHRLKRRIQCRLADDEYASLRDCIKEDGFKNIQTWLTNMVRQYIQTREVSKIDRQNV